MILPRVVTNTIRSIEKTTTDTMAALMKHGLFKIQHHFGATQTLVTRSYAVKLKKPNPDKKLTPKIDSTTDSLAEKGYLRPQKAYTPPEDVTEQFSVLCRETGVETGPIADLNKKFDLLNSCFKKFNHGVPNSLLHSMKTTNDVLRFYKTPRNATIPLDMMKNTELPKNLHIQYEYHRFHPETDTMFNGVTAFNRSSTLIPGLKTKKKYKGHEANATWPYNT